MALDWLLLERADLRGEPAFRAYGWSQRSYTFGYTQKFGEVRPLIPVHESWEQASAYFRAQFALVRRPSAGGLVDHGSDWTYALVVPAGHPVHRAPALEVYAEIHAILRDALAEQGVEAQLAPCPPKDQCGAVAQCFVDLPRANDLVLPGEQKIAGAAQKRSKTGLLVQGSLDRRPIRGLDWQALENTFARRLGEWLESPARSAEFPRFDPAEMQDTIKCFEENAWNRRR